MKYFVINLLVLLICVAFGAKHNIEQKASFDAWKRGSKKKYQATEMENSALDKFSNNKASIDEHNKKFAAKKASYKQGLWEMSDVSCDDVNKHLNGLKGINLSKNRFMSRLFSLDTLEDTIPPQSLNWTAQGYVTPVRNQGFCGSCYAFAATGALEGQYFKQTGNLTKLSEQNLVDCSKNANTGNWGCQGGTMVIAYEYVRNMNGISSASKYPYKGDDIYDCSYNSLNSVGPGVIDFTVLPAGNETLLKLAVAAVGPIAIAVDASLSSFQNYKSGVYDDPACSSVLNHGMLLTGYGTDPVFGDYWLIRNSYGVSWGERGYMRLARNKGNICGITNFAVFPIV